MSDKKTPAKSSPKTGTVETEPTTLATAVDASFDFEKATGGEIFGGSYPRLELNPSEVSAAIIHRKDTEIPLDDGEDDEGKPKTKMQTVHIGELPSGDLVSLPIAAIFMKHFKEAEIKEGDEYRIKRYADATKKRGKGSGNKMQVYAVLVTNRAETES